jgi:hypothetical protein
MEKTCIRFFKFLDGKQNLQFHWPYPQAIQLLTNQHVGFMFTCAKILNYLTN